jgi:hypothetical protein
MPGPFKLAREVQASIVADDDEETPVKRARTRLPTTKVVSRGAGHPSLLASAVRFGAVMAAMRGTAGSARAEPNADDDALPTLLFQEGRAQMLEGRIPGPKPLSFKR